MSDRQAKVIEWCKSKYNEKSKNWTKDSEKWSEDKKAFFRSGLYKCNLFVYDALVSNGVSVPTFYKNGDHCPPNTKEWYNGEVGGFQYIGCGEDALNKSRPGDIAVIYKKFLFQTLEHHIGFIYSPGKTISASPDDIVINDWGWRYFDPNRDERTYKPGIKNNVKIYRYNP